MNQHTNSPLLIAALDYAARGWPVLPLRPGTKVPLAGGGGHRDATTDPEQIREWWMRCPDANIGISLAKAGLVAVDVDFYKPECDWESFSQGKALPDTWVQETGRRGRHYIFKSPEGQRYPGKLCTGVDIKHEGYIVAAPSVVDGNDYRIIQNAHPAPAPGWLLAVQVAASAALGRAGFQRKDAAEYIQLQDDIRKGTNYHDAHVRVAAQRAANGMAEVAIVEELRALMHASEGERDRRWQERYDDIPRIVLGAVQKLGKNFSRSPLLYQTDNAGAFKLIRFDKLELKKPEFLIAGLIEANALIQIFGESGVGKSFVAFDMAASVASGRAYHGRAVRPAPVILIAGEGHNGIKRRLAAWEKHNEASLHGAPLYVSSSAAQFLDDSSVDQVMAEITAIAEGKDAPGLIVIDTLARNFGPGDENSNADMSHFVAALDALKNRFGCTVLVVHHTGHGDKHRSRGASSLKAALDAEFRADRTSTGIVVTCTKMKDAPPPPPLSFRLQPVEIEAPDGSMMGSAALVEVASVKANGAKPLTLSERRGVAALQAAAQKQVEAGCARFPVHLERWRDEYYALSTSDNDDSKRKAFGRVRKALAVSGVVIVEHDNYTLTGPHARPDDAGFSSHDRSEPSQNRTSDRTEKK